MAKYKDKDILKAIRNGEDHKALESLYRELFPKIRKLVNTTESKEEETKDILQESLLIFYKQVITNKFDDKFEISGFIYTIARNLWINRVKRKKRMVNVDQGLLPEIADDNVSDDLELNERREFAQQVFSQLEDKCKQLLTYTIFEELSMKEVAEKMGFTSANAATVASFRCKKYLMDLVKKNKVLNTLLN